jgi:hypothetical protein
MEDRSCQLSKPFLRVVFPLIQASGKSLYHKQLVGPSREEGTRGEGLEDYQTSWSKSPEMASEHRLIRQGGPGYLLDWIISTVVVACLSKPGSFDAPIIVVVFVKMLPSNSSIGAQ